MALEHHFVVVVREDGTMNIDSEVPLYSGCNVWDTVQETWRNYTEDEDVREANEQAFLLLSATLDRPTN